MTPRELVQRIERAIAACPKEVGPYGTLERIKSLVEEFREDEDVCALCGAPRETDAREPRDG